MKFLAVSSLLLFAGCGHSSDGATPNPNPGPSGPLEVTPAYFVGDGTLTVVTEGSDLPISLPPQGGHVVFVGAQIAGLGGDTISIRGRIRDPDSDAIISEEARTVVTRLVPGSTTLKQTDPETISEVANIAVCPDYATRAIDGQPYVLEIIVTELYVEPPRTASARRTITPRCPADGPDATGCACECAADYSLGKCPVVRDRER